MTQHTNGLGATDGHHGAIVSGAFKYDEVVGAVVKFAKEVLAAV